MPTTKNYHELHNKVVARPGARERLAELRHETLAEIGLYELRKALELSQSDVAAQLGITQSAISQLEHADDLKLSTLENYLNKLGARLQLVAVFEDDDQEQAIPVHIGDAATP